MLVALVLAFASSAPTDAATPLLTSVEPTASPVVAAPEPPRGTRERKALGRALVWLERHQGPEGGWSGKHFSEECPKPKELCGSPGRGDYDVGLTGLSLLAFLRAGHDVDSKEHGETVRRAAAYLLAQADDETGMIGSRETHEFLYVHAVATLALCRLQAVSPAPERPPVLQAAVDFLARGQNPGSGWRYTVPGNGTNDTSITGWVLQALRAAEAIGLAVEPDRVAGGMAWLQASLEESTGRYGYNAAGTRSSRITGVNEHLSPDGAEALTALALHVQLSVSAEERDLERHAASIGLLLAAMPVWGKDDAGVDMYYWLHGTDAMALVGGKRWRSWRKEVLGALLRQEHKRKHLAGSWDPVGPWGLLGGRVYSTAMTALVLARCVENP